MNTRHHTYRVEGTAAIKPEVKQPTPIITFNPRKAISSDMVWDNSPKSAGIESMRADSVSMSEHVYSTQGSDDRDMHHESCDEIRYHSRSFVQRLRRDPLLGSLGYAFSQSSNKTVNNPENSRYFAKVVAGISLFAVFIVLIGA